MKKKVFMLLSVLAVVSLAGCGNRNQTKTGSSSFAEDSDGAKGDKNQNILIAYFSRTGNTDFGEGIDAVTGASLLTEDGTVYGNTQYIANLIRKAAGGEISLIEVQEKYPGDYEDTVDQAEKEENKNARPALANRIDNLNDYEIIFLGFPNWWYDMPMAVYSFLDEYDLSGKTIIPFVTSGGSGFSDTIRTIQKLEPDARVIADGFEATHSQVKDVTFDDVEKWIKGLGIAGLE